MPHVTAEEFLAAERPANQTLRGRAQRRRRVAAEIDELLMSAGPAHGERAKLLRAERDVLIEEAEFIEDIADMEWRHAEAHAACLRYPDNPELRSDYLYSQDLLVHHRRAWRQFREGFRLLKYAENYVDDTYQTGG